jgi:hypothetical protein
VDHPGPGARRRRAAAGRRRPDARRPLVGGARGAARIGRRVGVGVVGVRPRHARAPDPRAGPCGGRGAARGAVPRRHHPLDRLPRPRHPRAPAAHRSVDVLRLAMGRLSGDPRIVALLVAWFFVLFVEGAAGFGTSVALAAPFLVSAGFKRVEAVAIALVGHAVGVSFGAVGTPILPQIAVTPYTGLELAGATAVVPRDRRTPDAARRDAHGRARLPSTCAAAPSGVGPCSPPRPSSCRRR